VENSDQHDGRSPELRPPAFLEAAFLGAGPGRDPALRRVARRGEATVAGARIAIGAVFLVLGQLTSAPAPVGVLTTALALALGSVGLGALLLIRRGVAAERLALATILLDVSLVTAGLLVLGREGEAPAHAHQRNLFACYLVVLGATGLRYDPRLSLYATAVVLLQYGGVVAIAQGVVEHPLLGGVTDLSMHAHAVRVALIAVTGAIATLVVLRVQELVSLSLHDPLTGLLNRRYFDGALAQALEPGPEDRPRVALALLDVDHFKAFNDRYGHAAGDAALRTVAAELRRSFRGTDLVARVGGEEFAVLLPGIGVEDATRRIEACRRAVASTRLPEPGRRPGNDRLPPVTVSGGLAVVPDDGASPGPLLRTADARLYEAKERGRNRLVGPRSGAGGARDAASAAEVAVST